MEKKKNLLFDITSIESYLLFGYTTGIGRTTLELLKSLNNFNNLPFNLTLFSQNIKGIGVHNLNSVHKGCHLYLPKRKPFTTISNKIGLKKLISGYDLLHIPHNTDFPEKIENTIYTIHDLIAYRYPEMWGLTKEMISFHKFLAAGCKAIVTCSESSKKDIIKFWEVNEDKIQVIPWGINRNLFTPDFEPITEVEGLGKDFFFTAACNHPRKQPELIIDAFDLYVKQGGKSKLVMLNPAIDKYELLTDLINKGKLIILNGINDRLLVKLYTQAKASIIVSLYEGFGLPVLESLACGTQVICAHNSSLIEAGGNIVDYIYELSPQCLSSKMLDYDKHNNPINKDSFEVHLKNFTWSQCASRYIDFWNSQLFS